MGMDAQPHPLAPANGTPTSPIPSRLVDELQRLCPRMFREPTAAEANEANRRAAEYRRQQERQRRSQAWARLIDSAGERYRHCTLDSFEITTPAQEAAVKTLRAYAADIDGRLRDGAGVLLYGPSGTGKDHALAGLARYAIAAGRTVERVVGAKLFSELRDAMDDRSTSERILARRLVAPDVLILSDPIPASQTLTPWQRDWLYRIVDDRYNSLRPTWVSLNVANGKEADERLGAPIVDRLRHGATVIHASWGSYRRASER